MALASLLALGACASTPDLGAAPQPKILSAQAAASFAAPTAAWPADGWWRGYGDPQLTTLIDEGLRDSPDLAVAQARVRRAEALESGARASLLPTLDAQGSVVSTKQSYNNGFPSAFVPHGYQGAGELTLDLNWEIDFWGKNRAAVAAAASDVKAARAEAAEARLTLSTAIAESYAELARLHAERDVAEQSLRVREQTLSLVSDRVTGGLDTRAELQQAAAGAPTAKAELAALDEQIALTRNRIAALMGAGPDRGLAITRPDVATLKSFGLPSSLAADLVGRRPDLAAARWRAEAAARRVGEARARFYPNVNLMAFIGVQSLGLDKLFVSGSDIGQAGPAVTLPIFEGGRLRAGLRGARADYDEAVAVYDGAVARAFQQVADAAAGERSLNTQLAQSREAMADNEAAYALERERYQGGLANYQAVLLAEDSMLRSRRAVADLQARALILDVQLVRALGGGFS
jgi:NodT family efflux transporter outer membrane factor (OMF) lipoprotein